MRGNWRTRGTAFTLCLGICMAVGAFLIDNLAAGVALGVVFGISLGEYWERRNSSEGTDESDARRFHRSRERRVLLGVCGGLSERYGWNTTLVRGLFVGATVLTGFVAPLAYLLFTLAPRGSQTSQV